MDGEEYAPFMYYKYNVKSDNTYMTNFKRTKLACYSAYFTMSSIFALPPILFVPLREMYGISYTLLGTLVLINFCTQLAIDLVFTFFSKYFNVKRILRIMPLITCAGMLIYALIPTLFPNIAYLGLALGTVIFSVSAGLSEVLLSPAIAAIPSDNPQRDMSMLHSLYAFGVFFVVVTATLGLKIFGNASWMYVTIFFALLPIIAAVLFMTSPIPEMNGGEDSGSTASGRSRIFGLFLCAGCIFFGSCSENAMTNWISSFMEKSLAIDKAVGDILGMALFAILLGIARISYAKYGKNICRVLLAGMISAAVCYITIGICSNVIISFIACILVGFVTSMLWPGTLIMMEEKLPGVGVAAFALMAASGDMGASIAPQLLGIVTDVVSESTLAADISLKTGLSPEQLGLKAGMLVTAIFPIIGAVFVIAAIYYFKKQKANN